LQKLSTVTRSNTEMEVGCRRHNFNPSSNERSNNLLILRQRYKSDNYYKQIHHHNQHHQLVTCSWPSLFSHF